MRVLIGEVEWGGIWKGILLWNRLNNWIGYLTVFSVEVGQVNSNDDATEATFMTSCQFPFTGGFHNLIN